MLESLFFGTLGVAVLMTVLTAFDRDEIAWPILAIPTWLICAVAVSNLEHAYAFLATDDTVVEHLFGYHGGAFMIYLFLGFAIVCIVIFINRVLAAFRETATKKVRY